MERERGESAAILCRLAPHWFIEEALSLDEPRRCAGWTLCTLQDYRLWLSPFYCFSSLILHKRPTLQLTDKILLIRVFSSKVQLVGKLKNKFYFTFNTPVMYYKLYQFW